ncbi:matrixin family metalloprotease [Flavobacterium lindanitolerans]|uniref:matrixin family metalloprotease n=1 Tax=Flavobacterium lindanitolerans TaxID=428988 RepID=UPI0027BAEE36|nr:matrixin family metalloprotease [Flavobacterium lindanitolerans]
MKSKQRYLSLILSVILFSCQKNNQKIVGIQPYGVFPKQQVTLMAEVIDSFYNVKTVILPHKELYKQAYINIKSPRYRADSIIRIQKRNLPDSLDFVVGLTVKDISTTKRESSGEVIKPASKYTDWGVMGLGFCPGKSCIISTFRLHHKNPNVRLERLKKIIIHELGHNLGLPHCKNKKCVMTDAVESIATIDNESLSLCEDCRQEIGF